MQIEESKENENLEANVTTFHYCFLFCSLNFSCWRKSKKTLMMINRKWRNWKRWNSQRIPEGGY